VGARRSMLSSTAGQILGIASEGVSVFQHQVFIERQLYMTKIP
jgi:hypothetical protein